MQQPRNKYFYVFDRSAYMPIFFTFSYVASQVSTYVERAFCSIAAYETAHHLLPRTYR